MIEKFSVRLRHMLEIRNMKAIDLADQTGIGKSSISFYLNDKCLPKQQRLFQISKVLNCNPAFLMGIDDNPEIINKATNVLNNSEKDNLSFSLSVDEMNVIKKYRQLNSDDQEEVDAILDFKLAKTYKKSAEKEGLA